MQLQSRLCGVRLGAGGHPRGGALSLCEEQMLRREVVSEACLVIYLVCVRLARREGVSLEEE